MVSVYALLIIIFLVIVASVKFRLHPFLALILAAIAMGFSGGMRSDTIISALTKGFGNTLESIGIVIAFGTVIGTFLERSGGARTMATRVLKLVGERRSPLAMSITGYIISVPVFCDSGFVIMAALNKALSRRTGLSLAVLAIALASGLYATHVFVPPTPGPLAAAAAVGADIGLVILMGLLVSIPVVLVGLLWAVFFCKRFTIIPDAVPETDEVTGGDPGTLMSFAPLLIPILLIALKSIADYPTTPFGNGVYKELLDFAGHPVIALMVGVFLAFGLKQKRDSHSCFEWVVDGLKNAGIIILITGAGGAFGNVLRVTGVGDTLGQMMSGWQLGIFLPFIIAAVLKTAQGSSTVAIITTAALVAPLLEALGLATPMAKSLVVLAIGAGSMTVSHVNDSYFWVVAQFSDMDTATALRCHTMATLLQGLTGISVLALLAWLLI